MMRSKGSGKDVAMTKSELIELIARNQKHLPAKDVELAIKHILELMSESTARMRP